MKVVKNDKNFVEGLFGGKGSVLIISPLILKLEAVGGGGGAEHGGWRWQVIIIPAKFFN